MLTSMETSEKTRVMEVLHNLISGKYVLLEELNIIAGIKVSIGKKLYLELQPILKQFKDNPAFSLFDITEETKKAIDKFWVHEESSQEVILVFNHFH